VSAEGILLTAGVVSYDSEECLGACLSSLLGETAPLSAEVIVVDNRSTDGSAALVRERFPSVRLVVEDRNRGYGAACNRIFREGRGSFVLLLNADVELREGCLDPLLAFLRDRTDAGIAGCRLVGRDGKLQRSCSSFPSLSGYLFEAFFLDRLLPRNRIFGKYSLGFMDYREAREVDVLLGAFLLVRRETISALNGMDPRFFMYSEETDFCYRARRAGWRIWYVPEGTAVHLGGRSVARMPERMFVENHRSKILYMRIHHGPFRAGVAGAILFLGAWNRLVLWASLGLVCSPFSPRIRERARSRVAIFRSVVGWHLGFADGARAKKKKEVGAGEAERP